MSIQSQGHGYMILMATVASLCYFGLLGTVLVFFPESGPQPGQNASLFSLLASTTTKTVQVPQASATPHHVPTVPSVPLVPRAYRPLISTVSSSQVRGVGSVVSTPVKAQQKMEAERVDRKLKYPDRFDAPVQDTNDQVRFTLQLPDKVTAVGALWMCFVLCSTLGVWIAHTKDWVDILIRNPEQVTSRPTYACMSVSGGSGKGKPDGHEIWKEDTPTQDEAEEEKEVEKRNPAQQDAEKTTFMLKVMSLLTTLMSIITLCICVASYHPAYPSVFVVSDTVVTLVTVAGAYLWVRMWSSFVASKKMTSQLSRKLVHMTSGPLFVFMWPFYSPYPAARFIAALVPLVNIIKLCAAGIRSDNKSDGFQYQDTENDKLVQTVSRSGDAKEVLGGPLIYTVVLFISTLMSWNSPLPAIIAIAQMACGDGIADIVGRRWGRVKWPFSKNKSYIGTLAFIAFGFLSSMLLTQWFIFAGNQSVANAIGWLSEGGGVWDRVIWTKMLLVSIGCGLMELVPVNDDNWNVPCTAAILTHVLFWSPMYGR